MNKKFPYLTEVISGVVLTGILALSLASKYPSTETFSLKAYDLLSKFRKTAAKVDAIHIVEIDEDSIANLGSWPWSRALVAQLIDEIVSQSPKLVGLNVLYIESDQGRGMEEISGLISSYQQLLAKKEADFKRRKMPMTDFKQFHDQLVDLRDELNGDALLATSIEQAGNVVLPMYFQPGRELGNVLPALPPYFQKEKLEFAAKDRLENVPAGISANVPLETFGKAALAIGHSNLERDVDGIIRRIPPMMRYGETYFPSFGLQLVREYLDMPRTALQWKPPSFLALKKVGIPLDETMSTYLEYPGDVQAFKRFSAIDVLTGAVPETAFKDKIVLVGVNAPGLGQSYVIPGGRPVSELDIWSTHLENILNQHFITRPSWATKAEWGMLILAALIIIVILPLMRARIAIPAAVIGLAAMAGASAFLMIKNGWWVSPAYGALLLISGYVLVVAKRLIFTEKSKEIVEAEGIETNKMLGLSFQGQGMLDLAFEKFRKCPVDDQMKDLLYNLGLDMERKRQFTKAAAVYEHIGTVDAKYKDIQDKIELLKKAGEGVVFGGIGKKGSDSTVVVEGLGQNATLGRYEVVKELGRGAMGIVYLGKDPKINRQVAIKTLRFEDDMSEEQMKNVKERFFREAESAGNLTHPNIIRIFDAGEDQDVAYIAMELLDGSDLKAHCEKANLFSTERSLEIVKQVADALDYAHKQGVVHRDIKPANLMMLKDGTLRITDFGIARIQATSKTATGAVLGTPAYMSPEQVNGNKKVDGRADIFSLGVTLFELLSGEKPFVADSIAALLYRIANVEHTDVREYNRQVPDCVIPVINKALAKDPEKRYQTAGEMRDDLRNCLRIMASQPKPSAPEATPAAATEVAATTATMIPPEPVAPSTEPTESTDISSELEKAFDLAPAEPATPAPEPAAIVEAPSVAEEPATDPFSELDKIAAPAPLGQESLTIKPDPAPAPAAQKIVSPPEDTVTVEADHDKTVVLPSIEEITLIQQKKHSNTEDIPVIPGLEGNYIPEPPSSVDDKGPEGQRKTGT